MSNNISFKSKINFVDTDKFIKTIGIRNCEKRRIDHLGKCIMIGEDLYTNKIRTCTGGGFVVPEVEVCAFHFLNSQHFHEYMESILSFYLSKLKPERALIIGSKRLSTAGYSLENFQKIKEIIKSNVENVTLFERHRFPCSQSSFHYSVKTDTWTILSQYQYKDKNYEVTTLKDLRRLFNKISIAKGDRLFVNDKEILPKDCPKIFVDKNFKILLSKPKLTFNEKFINIAKKIFTCFK